MSLSSCSSQGFVTYTYGLCFDEKKCRANAPFILQIFGGTGAHSVRAEVFHDTYYKMVNTDGMTQYEINALVFTFILFIIFISIV